MGLRKEKDEKERDVKEKDEKERLRQRMAAEQNRREEEMTERLEQVWLRSRARCQVNCSPCPACREKQKLKYNDRFLLRTVDNKQKEKSIFERLFLCCFNH